VHQQTTTSPEVLAVRRGDLPVAWSNLVHSAMAMDPAQRPQSANEFAALMIAATPNGEAIAKRSASLLFATGSGSFSGAQDLVRPPDEWSQVSMPNGTVPATAASRRPHAFAIFGILALLVVAGFLSLVLLRNSAKDADTTAAPAIGTETGTEATSGTNAATPEVSDVGAPVVTPIIVPLPDAMPKGVQAQAALDAGSSDTLADSDAAVKAGHRDDQGEGTKEGKRGSKRGDKRKKNPSSDPSSPRDSSGKGKSDKTKPPKGNEEDLFNLRK
jgi:hypothetical protein